MKQALRTGQSQLLDHVAELRASVRKESDNVAQLEDMVATLREEFEESGLANDLAADKATSRIAHIKERLANVTTEKERLNAAEEADANMISELKEEKGNLEDTVSCLRNEDAGDVDRIDRLENEVLTATQSHDDLVEVVRALTGRVASEESEILRLRKSVAEFENVLMKVSGGRDRLCGAISELMCQIGDFRCEITSLAKIRDDPINERSRFSHEIGVLNSTLAETQKRTNEARIGKHSFSSHEGMRCDFRESARINSDGLRRISED
jgi:chromosome segregation ATPase